MLCSLPQPDEKHVQLEPCDSAGSGRQLAGRQMPPESRNLEAAVQPRLMFIQQFSGVNAVIFFQNTIFMDAGFENAASLGFLVMLVQVIMTGISIPLMDTAGRKVLLLIACCGMTLCCVGMVVFFVFSGPSWLALVSSFFYIAFFSLGLGPIPWLMMGEIFPGKIRTSASSFAAAFNWTCSFLTTETISGLQSLIGFGGVFGLYAVVLVFGAVFVATFVPETKGRSFAEIEAILKKGRGRDVPRAFSRMNADQIYRQYVSEVPKGDLPSGCGWRAPKDNSIADIAFGGLRSKKLLRKSLTPRGATPKLFLNAVLNSCSYLARFRSDPGALLWPRPLPAKVDMALRWQINQGTIKAIVLVANRGSFAENVLADELSSGMAEPRLSTGNMTPEIVGRSWQAAAKYGGASCPLSCNSLNVCFDGFLPVMLMVSVTSQEVHRVGVFFTGIDYLMRTGAQIVPTRHGVQSTPGALLRAMRADMPDRDSQEQNGPTCQDLRCFTRVPTDTRTGQGITFHTQVFEGGENPLVLRDVEVHQVYVVVGCGYTVVDDVLSEMKTLEALMTVPSGVQASFAADCRRGLLHNGILLVIDMLCVTIIVDACHAGKMLDRASDETFPCAGTVRQYWQFTELDRTWRAHHIGAVLPGHRYVCMPASFDFESGSGMSRDMTCLMTNHVWYFSRGHVDYDKLRAHPVRDWEVFKFFRVLPRFLDWPQWKAVNVSVLPTHGRSKVFTYIMLRSLTKAGLHASLGKLFEEVTETQADLRSRLRQNNYEVSRADYETLVLQCSTGLGSNGYASRRLFAPGEFGRIGRRVVPSAVADVGTWHRVGRQACVGAMGAVVAALLQAFSEPVLNRVAVKRLRVLDAIREVRLIDILRFFRTVLATNLLKFPFFEAVTALSSTWTSVPVPLQGVVASVMYTSATLPVANYRYIKSLQLKVKFKKLYQAYFPTLLRDIIYGVTRTALIRKFHAPAVSSPAGDAWIMFLSVGLSCLASAPGNELRAYRLQPKKTRLPPAQFFELQPFLRSAVLGALIPATAIASGQFLVGEAEVLLNLLHLSAVWLMPKLVAPFLLLALWVVLRLESSRQYYDPYARRRMLQRLRSDVVVVDKGPSRSQRAASFANTDPALIVQAISESDPDDGGSEKPRRGPSGKSRSPDDDDDDDEEAPAAPGFAEVARFVAPSCCVVIANSSMTSVDKAFLGRSSSLQLAAMGPAASVFDSSSFLLTFLNTATLSLLGMSAGDPAKLRTIRSHAIFLATASGILLGGFLCVFATPLTRLLGANSAMLPFSVAYLQIRALGTPVERGTSVATSFCLAGKDGTTPLFVTLVGLVANVVGDWLLCPKYGLAGVAGASVLASALGYGYLVTALIQAERWPRPFAWPRKARHMLPFLRFAGP
ncbi:Tret1, partial [Symbiodinium sp. CCMP2456]